MSTFYFSPVTINDKPLILHWLKQDHIKEWIHGKGLMNTLRGLDKFLVNQVDNFKQSKDTQHWIGFVDGEPTVYLLVTNVISGDIYAQYCKKSERAITLDIFLGNRNYLGKGLADVIIKTFIKAHFNDIDVIFIDPEQKNLRAIHVYEKVGFKKTGGFIAPWHPVPHYIMKLAMKNIKKAGVTENPRM